MNYALFIAYTGLIAYCAYNMALRRRQPEPPKPKRRIRGVWRVRPVITVNGLN